LSLAVGTVASAMPNNNPTPQVLARKANGVPSASGNQTAGDPPMASKTKNPPEGEKIVIRRLPPGMTEAEFTSILGNDWKLGQGKVGWFSYAAGKVSQE
jgi:regulator of nonsense transcripts 3